MDTNKYAQMVSGVDSCVNYEDSTQNGMQIVKSTYEISALHMRYKYYVTHTYDPSQRCMVFTLDYDRRSDLDDTVGYWYVDPRGRASCRVFYSCECKLRGWVPGPVYSMMTKEAVKKATTWVERESVKEFRSTRAGPFNGDALLQLVEKLREQVATQTTNFKLPSLPPMPSLPQLPIGLPQQSQRRVVDWIGERRRAAEALRGHGIR